MPTDLSRDTGVARYSVRSVVRALDALDAIATSQVGLTLSEVAAAIHTSKSATYSLLRTLIDHGHLRETEGGPRYQLGVALIQLADVALANLPLAEIAKPVILKLSEDTKMTTRVALVDDGRAIFVERVDGPGMVRFHTPLGRREFAHTSAAGKAILACLPDARIRNLCLEMGMPRRTPHTIVTVDQLLLDLERVRERGFALDDEEGAEGVFCAGAAFFDHQGNCAGALSATSLKLDVSTGRMMEIGAVVRAHADEVSRLLGGPEFTDRKRPA